MSVFSRSDRLNPGKETPVPIERTSGRASEPGSKFWSREKFSPLGVPTFLLYLAPCWHLGCHFSAGETIWLFVSTLHSYVKAVLPVIHNYALHKLIYCTHTLLITEGVSTNWSIKPLQTHNRLFTVTSTCSVTPGYNMQGRHCTSNVNIWALSRNHCCCGKQ